MPQTSTVNSDRLVTLDYSALVFSMNTAGIILECGTAGNLPAMLRKRNKVSSGGGFHFFGKGDLRIENAMQLQSICGLYDACD